MATPKGRYRFLRLPFGLKSAPEIYLQTMSDLFGDLPGVLIYFQLGLGETVSKGRDHHPDLKTVIRESQH
ncbi:hypothetical protein OUZ56_012647 [Daphnia magna]|uniref:Uncharacterized protein n=1 Tax=Daphnia magna TaxID=35525 RepID=A0ABQ9Z3M1_9CRUS|nr:hypothetical protein OUZ56_012647 [Daphnia magna]